MNKNITSIHTFVICAYKESIYLEKCVQSVLKQEYHSNILISTSTPNEYIRALAKKYDIELVVSNSPTSLANDWNFALSCAETELITLAHQDDWYEPCYSKMIVEAYKNSKFPIILFSNYCELRNGKRIISNRLLRIKRMMLAPLKLSFLWGNIFVRRRILSLGSPICCPAVTFVKSRLEEPLFQNNMKSNIDWQAWERLSKLRGQFVYLAEPLMLHRIHNESTTSAILGNNARREEDIYMFRKFWPAIVARMIEKIYQTAEKSNSL